MQYTPEVHQPWRQPLASLFFSFSFLSLGSDSPVYSVHLEPKPAESPHGESLHQVRSLSLQTFALALHLVWTFSQAVALPSSDLCCSVTLRKAFSDHPVWMTSLPFALLSSIPASLFLPSCISLRRCLHASFSPFFPSSLPRFLSSFLRLSPECLRAEIFVCCSVP